MVTRKNLDFGYCSGIYCRYMLQTIDAPISVILKHNHKTRTTTPVKIRWENRDYLVSKIGYHHTYYAGRVVHHVYSVITSNLFFRLELNTETLNWRVTEVADAEVN